MVFGVPAAYLTPSGPNFDLPLYIPRFLRLTVHAPATCLTSPSPPSPLCPLILFLSSCTLQFPTPSPLLHFDTRHHHCFLPFPCLLTLSLLFLLLPLLLLLLVTLNRQLYTSSLSSTLCSLHLPSPFISIPTHTTRLHTLHSRIHALYMLHTVLPTLLTIATSTPPWNSLAASVFPPSRVLNF